MADSEGAAAAGGAPLDGKQEWATALLRQMEIASNHLLEQHRRLQQEIYIRLRSRLALINYSIGSTGGIAGIVAFLFARSSATLGPNAASADQDPELALAISIVFFIGSFIYTFFILNFLSHSGYIYAASRLIVEKFPGVLKEIEGGCATVGRHLGGPPGAVMPSLSSRIFGWERYITSIRKEIQFTDSKFELLSFTALSLVSYSLHIYFFWKYLFISWSTNFLLSGWSVFLVVLFVGGLVGYFATGLYAHRIYRQVRGYRDRELPPE